MSDEEPALNQGPPADPEESGDATEEKLSEDEAKLARLKEALIVKKEEIGALRLKLTVTVPRETLVYVNQPTAGRVRILSSRVIPPPADSKAPPRIQFRPAAEPGKASRVSFAAPLTIEVVDPDAAKDSLSSVIVKLRTSHGATVDVRCVISSAYRMQVVAGATDPISDEVADTDSAAGAGAPARGVEMPDCPAAGLPRSSGPAAASADCIRIPS